MTPKFFFAIMMMVNNVYQTCFVYWNAGCLYMTTQIKHKESLLTVILQLTAS